MQAKTVEVDAVEGRPPKTIDVPDEKGGACRYCLAQWTQEGMTAALHVSLRRLICSCARHLGCASRVSSRCGIRRGAGVFIHCADARRGVGPCITGADAVPRGARALRRVARVPALTGRLRPACRCFPVRHPWRIR